ncbi:MAG: hypothetical protein KAJ24_08180 [Candidatus Aenigmarchaeota archaeon]|nr:hypothetical protein [Candidatus Aenigmarchaeota archaeon]
MILRDSYSDINITALCIGSASNTVGDIYNGATAPVKPYNPVLADI